MTNAYQESRVDSCSFPIEGETRLKSVDETNNSEPAEDQSHTLPHKRTRLTDLKEDETMVKVMVADWLRPTPSTSTCHDDQDEDAMWDGKLAALVDGIEEGLRDEEGMLDANNDEMTEISKRMTYSAKLLGNETLMEATLSKDKTEEHDASEDSDNKPLYPTATVAVGTIVVLLALFTIKHNLPAEAIGNLLPLISLALPSSYCLPNTVNNFKNYFKKLRNPLRLHYYCFITVLLLFAALWFGEQKPAMWTFLKPHMNALKDLQSGVEFESPSRGKFFCKAVLLACTCDLPARCLVCNSMQYNGEYRCWKCFHRGKTVKTGQRGNARAFPFNEKDPKGPLRTNELTLQHAKEALKQQMAGKPRYVVSGVKCFPFFSIMTLFAEQPLITCMVHS